MGREIEFSQPDLCAVGDVAHVAIVHHVAHAAVVVVVADIAVLGSFHRNIHP